ncbi:MAG: serine protease [Elusimicrobiota bacterium]
MGKFISCLLSSLLLSSAVFAQVRPDVIYGDDDRLDLYQVQSPKLRRMADSTIALISGGDVTIDGAGGIARLNTSSYAGDYQLCQEEPFYEQETAAFCSGSLVGPDLLMTAGHCVRSQSACESTKFVFGFAVTEKGKNPKSVPAADVYSCKQLLGREEVGTGADWAIVKLDRPVAGHAPLKLNRSGSIPNGTPLIVIGHPAGLPTKVAGGAYVRNQGSDGHFVANLDTYGGNSGSAVFNAVTGQVEGILVRGEQDYVWRNGCRVSNVCADDGCRGEDVTRASAVLGLVPGAGPAANFRVGKVPSFKQLLQLTGGSR